ncbi:conserved hypothetical protein [Culex quinquefasciatus]|uniref:Distal membrane-arm assembly complex protein 1-like domain-containing protein n=1 Tax=Culex quinquefasciatus TaxID=7176 RepID=B0W963_CULQU|nr:conserved hypothetical protein [Culex quinquefasciatus]|eukprot:XP_001845247.1 conserved hypothetical protein [Culex quinquefasciatus]
MPESVVASRHKDCLPCRIVSGTGVLGMGAYVWLQAKKRPQAVGRYALFSVAAVAAGVGVTRLLDVYPFGKFSGKEQ